MDRDLLKASYRGDERAQYQLYKVCYGSLRAVCMRYLQDDNEINMVLNTGFLKVVKGLNSYKEHVPFEAWIKRIMINTVIDHHRKNKKYKETMAYTDKPLESYGKGPIDYNEADKKFDADELRFFIKKLSPMTNKVFNLYAVDGYTHKEIGAMLIISEGTSKWHLSNARKKLQEMMSQHGRSKHNQTSETSREKLHSNVRTGQF